MDYIIHFLFFFAFTFKFLINFVLTCISQKAKPETETNWGFDPEDGVSERTVKPGGRESWFRGALDPYSRWQITLSWGTGWPAGRMCSRTIHPGEERGKYASTSSWHPTLVLFKYLIHVVLTPLHFQVAHTWEMRRLLPGSSQKSPRARNRKHTPRPEATYCQQEVARSCRSPQPRFE